MATTRTRKRSSSPCASYSISRRPAHCASSSDYGVGLSPDEPNPEQAVEELVTFLPVLAYDGSNMTQIDAGGILDIAMAGTSRRCSPASGKSALLVNVDNDTLRKIIDNEDAMDSGDEHRGIPGARRQRLRDRHQQEREGQGDSRRRRATT